MAALVLDIFNVTVVPATNELLLKAISLFVVLVPVTVVVPEDAIPTGLLLPPIATVAPLNKIGPEAEIVDEALLPV